MSRYEKNLGAKTLIVGWDWTMRTFFAQVRDSFSQNSEAADEKLTPLLGQNFDEYTNFDKFIAALEEKGYELEASIRQQLLRDGGSLASYFTNEKNGFISEG